ncbi:MAG: FAD-dependent thymidylate synthase [Chloroflexi bacterium]|nr:FAD-dependent thymidylate synthase [Chloroflexota bacterium]
MKLSEGAKKVDNQPNACSNKHMQAAEAPTTTTSRIDYPPRRIYSVAGVPPEIQAYALAKYSRSSQGMLESIQELSQQKAEQFLTTFYFQYGHRSIADLAHLVFGLEQISILAAIAVVDEPVWDGQERSTRYQPFRKTGWHLPDEVRGTPGQAVFERTAETLLGAYEHLSHALVEQLMDAVSRPPEMADGTYRRTLRARAFDVARSLLPLATYTSVGQIVSARVLERQISRLLSSPYAEIRAVASELKQACQTPAAAPLSAEPQPAVAPTLVKYADASTYPTAVDAEMNDAAWRLLGDLGEPDRSHTVELVQPASDPLDEIVTTLLYRHAAGGHSYAQVQMLVEGLSERRREEIFDLAVAARGARDDLLRDHQSGYALIFDVLVDLGSYRDLHRHRRCVQIAQPLGWQHGFERAEDVFTAGLGAQAALGALEAGLGEYYAESLQKAETAAGTVADVSSTGASYLLPLGYRVRCAFKMDFAQAAYMIEQRTQPQGHFSYRRVAWQMYRALRERYPKLAEPIRAVDPDGPFDLLRR